MAWVAVYFAVGHMLLGATAPSSPMHAAVAWDMQQLSSGRWRRSDISATLVRHGPTLVLVSAAALWAADFPLTTAAAAPLIWLCLSHCAGAAHACLLRARAALSVDGAAAAGSEQHAALAQFNGDMHGAAPLLLLLCAVATAAHAELCVPPAVRARYDRWRGAAARSTVLPVRQRHGHHDHSHT